MSTYVTERNRLLKTLVDQLGISLLRANELVRAWEFEANRRGLDQRQHAFWTAGDAWISAQLAEDERASTSTGEP